MLDILKDLKEELKFEIVVCHINHLIREEAISDEEYVVNYCKENNIKCWIAPRDIHSGKNYSNEIIKGIKKAKVIVLVFSRFSIATSCNSCGVISHDSRCSFNTRTAPLN